MLVLSLAQPIGLKLREWLKNISGEALRYGVRVRHLLACGKQEFFKMHILPSKVGSRQVGLRRRLQSPGN
jgi:hypothetical protein